MIEGVGCFTIVDDEVVQESDLGVNFFLDKESLGEPRGKRCTELLLELNPEVQGNWSRTEKVLKLSDIYPALPVRDIAVTG